MLACVASVSARVREWWEESKKRNDTLFFRFRSNFRAITRLETLATQANVMSSLFSTICHLHVFVIVCLGWRRKGYYSAVPWLQPQRFC